jgi:sterol desaturase/sphingolipid hydroxylase (fatty acid hydroxylase superfamily)
MTDAMDLDLVARPLLFAALAALAFLPLERAAPAHAHRRRDADVAADLAFATAGQVLVRAAMVLAAGQLLAALDALAPERPLFAAIIAGRRARAAADVAAGLVLFELGGYAYHRLAHRVPWMWRLHEVHHSSRTLDWLASFRQHPLEALLMTLAQNAPLVLLHVPLGAHALVLALLKINTVFVHANLRVPRGPWRLVLATPRFHHRHHQRDGAVANYASLFPFIDRLFGTYSDEAAAAFGLPHPSPETFAGLLALPFRRRAPPPPGPGSTPRGSCAKLHSCG